MNLNAFELRDIYLFMTISTLFETEGITDIRFIRQRLQNHIDQYMAEMRKASMMAKNENKISVQNKINALTKCPSCENGFLVKKIVEGLHYEACPRCRYSRILP